MSRRLISTGSPFEKTAGYSRAVIDGDFAFVAGKAALKEGGFAMADIGRATYLHHRCGGCGHLLRGLRRDIRRGSARPPPLLVVAGLYKPEMKIEIEVTAKRRT
jgi:enamine deaminase RidA (YjgF/YER057c/UK114 family)